MTPASMLTAGFFSDSLKGYGNRVNLTYIFGLEGIRNNFNERDKQEAGTTYDLIANVVHDGSPEKGSYRVHVFHNGSGKWFEMNDLYMTEILPQMITLTEAYIQIYKRREEKQEKKEKEETSTPA